MGRDVNDILLRSRKHQQTLDVEALTRRKVEWSTQQDGKALLTGWPHRYYEHLVVAGLPLDTDVFSVAAKLAKGKQQGASHSSNTLCEPQLLFAHSAGAAVDLPLPADWLATFCFPKGIMPQLVQRSNTWDVLHDSLHQPADGQQFAVFHLKAAGATHLPLFGVCCYVTEGAERPPFSSTDPDRTWQHDKYAVIGPRCYCLLSHYPFFDFHFSVLRMVIASEHLLRDADLRQEMNRLQAQLSLAAARKLSARPSSDDPGGPARACDNFQTICNDCMDALCSRRAIQHSVSAGSSQGHRTANPSSRSVRRWFSWGSSRTSTEEAEASASGTTPGGKRHAPALKSLSELENVVSSAPVAPAADSGRCCQVCLRLLQVQLSSRVTFDTDPAKELEQRQSQGLCRAGSDGARLLKSASMGSRQGSSRWQLGWLQPGEALVEAALQRAWPDGVIESADGSVATSEERGQSAAPALGPYIASLLEALASPRSSRAPSMLTPTASPRVAIADDAARPNPTRALMAWTSADEQDGTGSSPPASVAEVWQAPAAAHQDAAQAPKLCLPAVRPSPTSPLSPVNSDWSGSDDSPLATTASSIVWSADAPDPAACAQPPTPPQPARLARRGSLPRETSAQPLKLLATAAVEDIASGDEDSGDDCFSFMLNLPDAAPGAAGLLSSRPPAVPAASRGCPARSVSMGRLVGGSVSEAAASAGTAAAGAAAQQAVNAVVANSNTSARSTSNSSSSNIIRRCSSSRMSSSSTSNNIVTASAKASSTRNSGSNAIVGGARNSSSNNIVGSSPRSSNLSNVVSGGNSTRIGSSSNNIVSGAAGAARAPRMVSAASAARHSSKDFGVPQSWPSKPSIPATAVVRSKSSKKLGSDSQAATSQLSTPTAKAMSPLASEMPDSTPQDQSGPEQVGAIHASAAKQAEPAAPETPPASVPELVRTGSANIHTTLSLAPAGASDHLDDLHALAALGVPMPGETACLVPLSRVACAAGCGTIVHSRPELGARYPVHGRNSDLLVYAQQELADSAAWAVAVLCRHLSLDNLLCVLGAVLLEEQVVVLSPELGTLSVSVLALSALLRPLVWPHLLMPLIPSSLAQLLHSPTPFLVGVAVGSEAELTAEPWCSECDAQQAACMREQWVCVDLQRDSVTAGGSTGSSQWQLPGWLQLKAALVRPHAALAQAHAARERAPAPGRLDVAANPTHLSPQEDSAVHAVMGLLRAHIAALFSHVPECAVTRVDGSCRVPVLVDELFVESFASREEREVVKRWVHTAAFQAHSDMVLAEAAAANAW